MMTASASASAGTLPNGWTVTPAGALTPLGTLPLHVVVDPSGNWLAITNAGYGRQSVTIVNAKTGRVADSKTVAKTFYGVAFAPDDSALYVSTAAQSGVRHYSFDANRGKLRDLGAWQLGSGNLWISGIATSPDGKIVYAAANLTDKLYAVDARNGRVLWKVEAGRGPYAVLISPDGRRAFVSDWIGATITAISTLDGSRLKTIPVDAHPNAMALSRDGAALYIACANANTVVRVDARAMRRSETIDASLWPHPLEGTTPNGVALSSDERTLYVADADDDVVTALDARAPSKGAIGAIPVGWYATDVAISRDGKSLYVLDGKGVSGHSNPAFPHSDVSSSSDDSQYVASLATGDLERVAIPDSSGLISGLRIARQNARYDSVSAPLHWAYGKPAVKHVIYVIKENRTYDEVLGDDPRGNGDAKLAIFARRITPNIHRLADEFVLFDNLEVDSEVSADGHNWATAAYATDYVQKLWPSDYSGRGRAYDFSGSLGSNPSAGYLWDDALSAGRSVRDYGEFIDQGPLPSVPVSAGLRGHVDPRYRAWNLKYSDQARIDEWEREFRAFERAGTLPDLEILWLPDDHTAATAPGYRTPFAMVASNDYAVGRLVQTLSRSRYWKDTVVFVVEDDAQAGPDHVSDQRTEALVAGGPVRRNVVDHTHYTQCSILRTIELLLDLHPMSQFDAVATPLTGALTANVDLAAWTASKPNVDIRAVNKRSEPGTQASLRLDLRAPDAADITWILVEYAKHARR